MAGLAWLCMCIFICNKTATSEYFSPNGFNPDFFEYHLPAANLALHHRFPVYGFLSHINDYKLCAHPDSVKYYRDTYYAGTMFFSSKPPLYSLLIGMTYSWFGFKPQTAVQFNVLCLMVLCFSVAASVYLMNGGWMFSIIAATVVYLLRNGEIFNYDAELLTACLVGCTCLLLVIAAKYRKAFFHVLAGVVTALLLLSKGYFLPVVVFIAAGYIYGLKKLRTITFGKYILYYLMGVLVIWLPWIVFINSVIQKDIPNRLRFSNRLEATSPRLMLQHHREIFNRQGKIREDVIEDILKFHQYQHARENDFILITNQLGEYNILNVHNEFCTDGDFHPEWRIIKTSFFNQLPKEMNKHCKLLHFYREHPWLFFRLMIAKVLNAFSAKSLLLYVALFFIPVFFSKKNILSSWAILSIISIAWLAIVCFYGDERFAQTADAANASVIIRGVRYYIHKYFC
ncbi:MAG: glycosyltransferase family 39 protein [Chitinophagales bacterium]|nr:glycosyltransferase family 39 protein [Chitinophagales bacterium]